MVRLNLELLTTDYLKDFEIENYLNQEADENHSSFDDFLLWRDKTIQRLDQTGRNEWSWEQTNDHENTTHGDRGIASHVQPCFKRYICDYKDGEKTQIATNSTHKTTCHKAQTQ